jgi:hypothetical protein
MRATTSCLRRATTAVISIVAVAATGLGAAATAPSAHAYTTGAGATWYPVGSYCDARYHQLYREAYVTPQAGWSSQYVRFRTFTRITGVGEGWSGWRQAVASRNTNYVTVGGWHTLPTGTYRFYTEFQWWNGKSWSASVGAWDNHYAVSYGGSVASSRCYL